MTGTDIVQAPKYEELPPAERELREQVRMIQSTNFVPNHYRGKPHEIYAAILTGRAIGLDPMTSLRWIYIVDGKPAMGAECMVALARRRGHSITGATSAEGAEAVGTRGDNGDTMTVRFGPEDAERAGLAGKQTYQKHPASMYWARAVSQLCRSLFPDVLAGVSYTPDEAELTPEERSLQATDDLPLPPDEGSLTETGAVEEAAAALEPAPVSVSEDSGPVDPPVAVDEAGPEQTALALPDVVRRQMETGE